MSTIKSIYIPIRRYFFLDDDEIFEKSDLVWLIAVPAFTAIIILICFIATFSNY